MPRLVLFDGAPTLEQCLQSARLPSKPRGSWTAFSFDLSSTRSTSSRDASQQQPAAADEDEHGGRALKERLSHSKRPKEELEEPTASQFADADTTGLFSSRHGGEVPSQSRSFFFPPATAHLDTTTASTAFYDESATYDTTYGPDGQSMGAPPRFKFLVSSLTPLSGLAGRIGRKVSVLAAVVDVMPNTDEMRNLPSKVNLTDSSGKNVTLILWKNAAREICSKIRRGDILYLGTVAVSEYNSHLQLTYGESTSQIGICWRSLVFDDEDLEYQFDEGWRYHHDEARRVLGEVDHWRRTFEA
ncbi:hypothetical protein JCM8097_006066 [Rhodosporidiobolus ruineniae]